MHERVLTVPEEAERKNLAGFIGHAEGNLMIGVVMSAVLTVLMGAACWLVFRSGWRLKS